MLEASGESEGAVGRIGRPGLPPVELEVVSVNSNVEGTVVVGASAWRSRFEVTKEFHTSALKAPSE